MFKHLREEVPEDSKVGRQVRNTQSATVNNKFYLMMQLVSRAN